MRRILTAALCAILLLNALPGRTQSVIVTPPAGDNHPTDDVVIEKPRENLAPVVLTISEPAYVDMPIWASIRFQGFAEKLQGILRYPFTANPAFTWGHSFEVTRDGVLLPPRKVQTDMVMPITGPFGGSGAPPSSPTGRLPLHLCYRFDTPGSYRVRYVLRSMPGMEAHPLPPLTSAWVTLQITRMTAAQRRKWQQEEMAHPPTDVGLLVGDYLPSLLASPDDTVLPAFLTALRHADARVSSYALQSLAYFDDEAWSRAMLEEIKQHGPADPLVRLLSCRRKLSETATNQFAAALMPYLAAADPSQLEGTLHALSLLQSRVTLPTRQRIDAAVLAAVPHLLTLDSTTKRGLADYLGGVKSAQSRKLLWQLTGDRSARNQALHSLCRIGDPRDSRRLDDEMRTSQRSL